MNTIADRIIQNIDAILISLILNINILRFFLNIEDTNIFLYFIYILSIITVYRKNKANIYKSLRSEYIICFYYQYWGIILILALITGMIVTSAYFLFFKFLITVLIALACIGMPDFKIRFCFLSFYILNVLYGIIILTFPGRVTAYMSGSINYLNMTLTLGLCLTFSLVTMVQAFYEGKKIYMLCALISSIFFFATTMPFSARGVLLFPPIITIYIAFLKRHRHKIKFVIFLSLLSGLIFFAFLYFMQNASEFALIHMTHLFENTEGESRVVVWSESIKSMIDNYWIFWGAGLNGFQSAIGFYPHNIFLHILSDFGLFALIGLCVIVFFVFNQFFKLKKLIHSHVYILSFVGFLYYLMTFCKSFSMYDSCPLLIMISFCFSFDKYLQKYKNRNALKYTV